MQSRRGLLVFAIQTTQARRPSCKWRSKEIQPNLTCKSCPQAVALLDIIFHYILFQATSRLHNALPDSVFDNIYTLLFSLVYYRYFYINYNTCGPGLVHVARRSVARPTGILEVESSIAKSSNILFVEICHEIISTAILSLPLVQEEQLSVPGDG